MIPSAPCVRRPLVHRLVILAIFLEIALGGRSPAFGKLETWREDSASEFGKGHRRRVVVSDLGAVRLGQAFETIGKLDATHVWDLARTPAGALYAATGDSGKVFRREGDAAAPRWEVVYDADDSLALSVAVLADGHVVVGTGPGGQVVDVSDPKHPASRPGPDVRYIWDLAADRKGNLYAATGPTGQLWKRSPDGRWTLLLDSKHPHLLCVAVAPDGSVFAGSDGEGLIYRIDPAGKTSVVYDAPQSEVRTLLIAPDGSLYAGTATEAGGGGGATRSSLLVTEEDGPPAAEPEPVPVETSRASGRRASDPDTVPQPSPPDKPGIPGRSSERPGRPGSSTGSAASPRPASPGDNAVYRIDPEGVPREVFRARVLVYALAWEDDRLLVGTGPEGQIFEVRDLGRDAAPIARLDTGQVLALLGTPDGVVIGTGDPGSIVRLLPGHVSSGTLVSDVHDTKLISRFGALSWRADVPEGTSVALQVRSGNVGEPDETWSDWSAEQSDPQTAKAGVPAGRFVQYRATLRSNDNKVSPAVRSVSLRYQSANLPPEITKVDVPDLGAGEGAARQGKLALRWEASDPNGDDLEYSLLVRKDGWPDWIKLGEAPLTEPSYSWDTTTMPEGNYRLRVSVTDRPSNSPDDAQTRARESEAFIVDHEPPSVSVDRKGARIAVALKDSLTRITKASYSLDGGEWIPVFPDDGLFDTPRETLTISLPDLKPGPHILVIRATDAAGNLGSNDLLIKN